VVFEGLFLWVCGVMLILMVLMRLVKGRLVFWYVVLMFVEIILEC